MQQTHYTWPGSNASVSVQLNLDVVDKLLPEVLSGIGATPRRAAERGGLLLGSIQQKGSQSIVFIEDFKPVACSHKTGPSFELSDADATVFDRAFASVRPGGPTAPYAVGYYRSHTREGLTLAPSDLQILKDYFPAAANVALIIKPFATRTSTAGFFLRNGGQFPEKSPQEFAFKSTELMGSGATKVSAKAAPEPVAIEEPEPSLCVPHGLPTTKFQPPTNQKIQGKTNHAYFL